MKKISQTALYLRRGQSGLEQDAGQGRGQASLLTVPDPAVGGSRRRREDEIYCPAPAPQPLLAWAAGGDVAPQRGRGRPSPGGYEGGRRLAAPQHVAPRCTAAVARAARESRSPGVSQHRGLFAAHHGKVDGESISGKGQLGSPLSMQERGSPRCWVPHPPSPPGILDVPPHLHQSPALPILGPVSCCHLVRQASAQVPASLVAALRLESKQRIL